MVDRAEVYRELRSNLKEFCEKHNIDPSCADWSRVALVWLRDAEVRTAYRERMRPGESEAVKEELCNEFGLNRMYINQVLYEQIAEPL
jgi:hypothetical protein